MIEKPAPMPHVVVNLHKLNIENAFTKTGQRYADVREVVLGRGHISFLFNKGQRAGAITIQTRNPADMLSVWSWCFEPTKKQTPRGLDQVA